MSHVIDPEVATALAALQASGAYSTSLPRGDVLARREAIDALLIAIGAAEARTVGVVTADYEIPGHGGTPIHVRWYSPARSLSVLTRGAAVVYCHGGGYILGSTDTADTVVRAYVGATGVPFLSVDYRLSPEAQHPTSVEDCYAALQWLTEHSSELSVDPDRVAVMGDSAGGGLAAAVALLARERGGPAIAAQVLIYPMLDDRTDQVSPVLEPYLVWTVDDNVTGWDALLGDARGDRTCRRRPRPPARPTSPTSRRPTSRWGRWTCCATRSWPTARACRSPGCRSSCTSTEVHRTPSRPSRPAPTSRDARSPTGSVSCARCRTL
ncbi:alpha/beta hydrolase fold domain-containing protein [Arsenicicoccus piscis]|uniref:Alpha/beta hydrolase fold-3 domain-containing protein n=1 Tax=Arsenicicoccus piscis TaxID=673954 RepID=A0ABQ6HTD9_9MICO|nr:alpha/beta hydrolase fold domain-containing protein [Arsenicicoccus piscis]GMA21791.1 hypothetical protein GCM10025862_38120 [Arsenicicoccus piscis]